jgi:enoyl-CoA hydratase
MTLSSEVLSLDVEGHVATLWLDREVARNAMGSAFWRDLPLAAAEIASDPSIRVVVLAAKGPHFTVGLDLKELGGSLLSGDHGAGSSRASANAALYHLIRTMQQSITAIAELAMPVIASVHGYCIGGGVDLITACDIRLCASDARFSVREAKMAIVADMGTLQRLPRIIGPGHVAELAFSGKDIDATRAQSIGLVNAVHGASADDVLASAYELANEIAANSPLAVRGTKAVLRANDGRTIEEGLDFVARWNTTYLQSNDLREALTAFLERREPHFEGD